MSNLVPFNGLTPACILDAVESLGFECDGRLLALNSYENRVWQLGVENGSPLVVKFYRPNRWSDSQIAEEHEFVGVMAAAELPVVAPMSVDHRTLFEFGGFRFAIYPRQAGRAPELDQSAVLEWMGRLMARLHTIGAAKAFAHRETLDVRTFGYECRDWLLENCRIPVELESIWAGVVSHALDCVHQCYDRAGDVRYLRLHGDCHAGNVLWVTPDGNQPGGPHFVDFDDSRMGPAIQDLWMLLSGSPEEMGQQFRHVLAGYEMFREFDDNEIYLIEALRTLRLIHHSEWLARRWEDPAFPAAFPWFATNRYWEEKILELREQISRMQEPALCL